MIKLDKKSSRLKKIIEIIYPILVVLLFFPIIIPGLNWLMLYSFFPIFIFTFIFLFCLMKELDIYRSTNEKQKQFFKENQITFEFLSDISQDSADLAEALQKTHLKSSQIPVNDQKNAINFGHNRNFVIYHCKFCGRETTVSTNKSIIKCPVCGNYLCPSCSHYNFCENHWNALRETIKHGLKKIGDRAEYERKHAKIIFFNRPSRWIGFSLPSVFI